MNCNKCMKFSNTLYDGLCYDCWQAEDRMYDELIYNPPEFNYECPECKGRYNIPAFDGTTEEGTSLAGTNKYYRCPFCGFKMEGLNDL